MAMATGELSSDQKRLIMARTFSLAGLADVHL